jgi:chloramphenicol O-acetyltransferase type A
VNHMDMIDLDRWDRKEHFTYFRSADYPQFNICASLDITRFLDYVKENKLPFYYAMIFVATVSANSITNFRYRIRNDKVVLHDRLHPSFTHLNKENGLFKYVTADMGDDLREFARIAGEKAEQQKGLFAPGDGDERDDLLYLTCIPWVSFTHISHTITLSKDDSIPRISWGKYFSDSGKTLLPFSVQVNHALTDGYHIGQYYTVLQNYFDHLS